MHIIDCLFLGVEIEGLIEEKMLKSGDSWQCQICLWTTKYRTRLWEHVESKHLGGQGFVYSCPYCCKHFKSKNAFQTHKSRSKGQCQNVL